MGTYDGDGILTDVLKPDILDGASSSKTVHTLALVLANDDVLEGSALSQDEYSVGLA